MAIDQDQFKAIVSGRRRDVRARGARFLLRGASLGYRLAVGVRNALYDHHLLRSHRANAFVICAGNLTTGGTGKTPLVAWLCRYVRERELPCAILTRGYKTQQGKLSDEPALLADQCGDVPVIINPDRVAGAAEAIRSHGAQVLVMDDGFQHRRLARDLDIVAIDSTLPFGYGRVLPAGLLREPIAGLKRSDAVVLTRCDQVSDDAIGRIEEAVHRVNPDLIVARSVHQPTHIETAKGEEIDVNQIRGKRIFAFCGIGNPKAFFGTIERLGGVPAGSRSFDDHYRYTDDDIREIAGQARERKADLILTTQKDWTKIGRSALLEGRPPMACLTVQLQITTGAERLTALIDRALGDRMQCL